MIHVRATFIGPAPSLGYTPGERYELAIDGRTVRDVNGEGRPCPYATIESFLRNWSEIQHPYVSSVGGVPI